MKLKLHRKWCKDKYTISNLYLVKNGKDIWLCNTLEPKVRDYNKDGDLNDLNEAKVYGETAIPYGEYKIDMNTVSPKYSNFNKYPAYRKYNGKLPRLINVPHFEGVLIHIGNTKRDTEGCILVGRNLSKGMVLNSTSTFYNLMDNFLLPAYNNGEEITIDIV